MEYRIGYTCKSEEGLTIDLGKYITSEDFEKITCENAHFESLRNNTQLYKLILLNFDELVEYIPVAFKALVKKAASGIADKNEEELQQMRLEVNRKFLNYLFSLKTYLDHSETFIKRKFGEKSREAKDFKYLTSYNYDTFFAYRFIYKLRNYAQHCGLPIEEITINLVSDREKNAINAELDLNFNTKSLLNNFENGWGVQLKAELQNMEDIEVMEVIIESKLIFETLHKNFEVLISPHLIKAAKFLYEIFDGIDTSKYDACVFFDFRDREEGKEAMRFQTQYLAWELIKNYSEKI